MIDGAQSRGPQSPNQLHIGVLGTGSERNPWCRHNAQDPSILLAKPILPASLTHFTTCSQLIEPGAASRRQLPKTQGSGESVLSCSPLCHELTSPTPAPSSMGWKLMAALKAPSLPRAHGLRPPAHGAGNWQQNRPHDGEGQSPFLEHAAGSIQPSAGKAMEARPIRAGLTWPPRVF